ncbi:nmrA-like family protein-like protein [Boeremia exigua]|uniref:nmrA-like family protein-like protein n=1 Tax=Boeremia exigua TaxID=749465 RepID=UPI001E8E08BD|nr:nmrA-like family protein-like protein [Boeremia exigua]KAH6612513.1 nmrA-like family protein-like protein [Boeremia exigua]
MVKVAVAGGTGNVAREAIDKIRAQNKHEVTPLKNESQNDSLVQVVQVDYRDTQALASILTGTDVVLCFFAALDQESTIKSSKNLIDACVEAGVKRFAPSEWACRNNAYLPHYQYKDAIRAYLEDINKDRLTLEYTLFQPGLFTNYFAYPHSTTRHFSVSPWFVDFENRRAIIVGDGRQVFTTTTVEDFSSAVAQSLDYEGTWPVNGGVVGSRITVAELVKLAEKLRGPITVDSLDLDELKAGQFNASWVPIIQHPGIPDDQREAISRSVMAAYVLSTAQGGWDVPGEWNERLPSFRPTSAEEYLSRVWESKP